MSGELEVRVAGADTLEHSESISDRIRFEVEAGAIGMALRSPELIRERMLSGDALLALYSSRGRKGPPPHRAATCGPPPPRRLLGAERLWRGQPQPPAGCAKTSSHQWPRGAYLGPTGDGLLHDGGLDQGRPQDLLRAFLHLLQIHAGRNTNPQGRFTKTALWTGYPLIHSSR